MVAKIGENGQPFEVDNGLTLAATSGRLYLGVNDNEFGDNSGQWQAVVSVPQSQCPEILFAGVRGSGETATGDGLGFGVPVATHRWVLQREFDIRVQPVAVNYDARPILGENALDVANNLRSYEPSVENEDCACWLLAGGERDCQLADRAGCGASPARRHQRCHTIRKPQAIEPGAEL